MELFKDRTHAGQLLAQALTGYANQCELLILALPRGGLPVAYEVAKKLNAPMDLCLVRKLGVPGYSELAMGAIAYDGTMFIQVFNEEIIDSFQISDNDIQSVIQVEQAELLRRNSLYRQSRPFPSIKNHTIILVDDGVATGATMQAAIAVIKQAKPKRLIIAVPVAEPTSCRALYPLVDEVICLMQPVPIGSVGMWYRHFPQLTDAEVINFLHN